MINEEVRTMRKEVVVVNFSSARAEKMKRKFYESRSSNDNHLTGTWDNMLARALKVT
jgi:hypothetical protein